jgi:alpha-L-rhamnosidase
LSLIGIKGHFSAFGTIKPNPGQTEISDVLLKDFDVALPPDKDKLAASGITGLKFENVKVNGQPQSG